ncbi:MAG: carboxypeptidase regulatory-like domain-containing protein [bacterium]|nr:carboxypeptidase regulatory-like domain-containing protein [bacterium]
MSDRHFRHHTRVVDPIPAGSSGLIVQLEQAPTVQRKLIVTDQNGEAVENVSVSISADGLSGGPGNVSGITEIDLPDRSGGPCTINFYSKGHLPLSLEGVDTENLPEPWPVELRAISGIQGRVLADGAPVRRAKVNLFSQVQAPQVKKKGNTISRRDFFDLSRATCDKQGVFQVEHSHDGGYVLIASARGYADALFELPNYEAAQGETGITLAMNKGGEVSGTVFDAAGKPASRALLALNHQLHKLHRKRAGRDGTFRFRGVPEGRWMLRVVQDFDSGFGVSTFDMAEDWQFPANCTVVANQTTQFDLHLLDPAGTSVRGTWDGASERDEGWSATLSTPLTGAFGGDPFEDRWSSEQPLTSGQKFEFSARPGRDYHLRLSHASLRGRLYRKIAASDLPAQVDAPTSFTTLRAHLRTPIANGETAEGLIVEWEQDAWTYRAFLSPKEDGTFGPLRVPVGTLTLTWKTPGSAEATDLQVEALPDQERDVEL